MVKIDRMTFTVVEIDWKVVFMEMAALIHDWLIQAKIWEHFYSSNFESWMSKSVLKMLFEQTNNQLSHFFP